MTNKLFVSIFSVVLLNIGIVQAQWSLEKCPTRNNLNAISLIGDDSGWIVGDKGTILYKTGTNWIEYPNPTSENLNGIYMLNKNDAWAVGANGTIIHYDGRDWKPIVSPTKNNLLSICFKDSENGIAVGDFGTIIIYKNRSWDLVEKKITGNLFTAYYENDNAWIGGGLECVNVPIIKLEDNNGIAINNHFDPYASIYSIYFLNANNGWAVGSPSTILHFDGTSWEKPIISDNFSSLKSIFFSDENNGLSVGYGGTIMIFSDNQWIRENSGVRQTLNAAAILKENYYAVGDNGTIILKNINSDNFLAAKSVQISERIECIEVFPNPADEELNISIFYNGECKKACISIVNMYGQIILQKELLFNDKSWSYAMDTKDLKNGLYILKATVGDNVISNKFIIRH